MEVETMTGGFQRIRDGDTSTLVWFHNADVDGPATLRAALDKVLSHQAIVAAGLPTPGSTEVRGDDRATAHRFLRRAEGPCVVKPARGTSSGKGVTCGITTGSELERALRWASKYAADLVVERHFVGDEYRVLVLNGRPLDVVKRRPLTLTGNGRDSVADLISAENARRRRAAGSAGLAFVNIDLDTILTLERAGLTLRSVPKAGVAVPAKSTVNVSGARDSVGAPLPDVHPLAEEAAIAARAMGLGLAGVDVITPDPSRPLARAGGAILEVNGTPGLHYHYVVSQRTESSDVAVPILSAALDAARRRQ